MKRTILCIGLLTILTGCDKQDKKLYSDQQLKNTLIEYGQSVYESDSFPNKVPSDNIYTMNLVTLESIEKDISMFLNRKCDKEETRIELKIVSEEENIRFLYSPILECE